jgi:creatinine amidohydrolase
MRIEELNWMDVEEYLKHDDRLILVLGATEQHGYLSLCTDTKIPQALADAASQKTGVLIAPSFNYGISPYFLAYPGTISLRTEIYVGVVEDIIRSVYRHGFRRIIVLNGHGGNDAVGGKLVETANDLPGLKINWYSWWESNSVSELAMRKDLKPEHASWMEAFEFTKVCPLPEGEKITQHYFGLLNAADTRTIYGDGVFGGKYQADAETMAELFEVCLKDVLTLLEEWV